LNKGNSSAMQLIHEAVDVITKNDNTELKPIVNEINN